MARATWREKAQGGWRCEELDRHGPTAAHCCTWRRFDRTQGGLRQERRMVADREKLKESLDPGLPCGRRCQGRGGGAGQHRGGMTRERKWKGSTITRGIRRGRLSASILITSFYLTVILDAHPPLITVLLFVPVTVLVIVAVCACAGLAIFCFEEGQIEENRRLQNSPV
uniref:Uncharacterized protein n=1 Tax=Oryza glumipatula TaxID=40148 RepID=A0A0D9YIK3_9ORYZ